MGDRNIARALKIPPFINKLYSIVNDSDTDRYIHWSDSGDTFFVPNPEALAREVLPRYFKHSNYSSFVRQLNMYGFNKVPHLHQGVLHDGGSSELWEFTNENFQRDKPDLLVDVHRKVSTATEKKAGVKGEGEPSQQLTNYIEPAPTSNGTQDAQIDVGTVVAGFTQIQKQQAYISTSLLTLQQSNQRLWQEAAAARERHRQHEETIKKLLQFVSSVYGGDVAGVNAASAAASAGANAPAHPYDNDQPGNQVALVPKKRQLMLNNLAEGGELNPAYDFGGGDSNAYEQHQNHNAHEDISRFTHISPESQSSAAGNTPGSEYVESSTSTNNGNNNNNNNRNTSTNNGNQSTKKSPHLTIPELSSASTQAFDNSKALISPGQLDIAQFASLLSPRTTQRLVGGGGSNNTNGHNNTHNNASDYLNFNAINNPSEGVQMNENQMGAQRSQLNELSYDLDALQQSINTVVNNMGLNPTQASEILQASQSQHNDHQAMAELFKGYDSDLDSLLRGMGEGGEASTSANVNANSDANTNTNSTSNTNAQTTSHIHSPSPFNFVEEAEDAKPSKKTRY
ncbi:hypothetical protein E3P86_00111 [Wallemia ichthyophaga]|uniref:HSF-type DNA-binding domain-containing protein n=1 Tax=Wallemia ichthyophaga TaxID=245174 RepID=A0A4T0JLM8_WALIC|nr:hypothetical protein E3P86_00111 [Wallemia ichthyophaga]